MPATVANAISAPGVSLVLSKVSVYRNGAKLRAGTDYTLGTDVVTLVPNITTPLTNPDAWSPLPGDLIEVHWIN